MLKFEYVVELGTGYRPTMQDECENEVRFVIEAKNRVTADRMVKAMFTGATNVVCVDGICIDQ